MKLKKLNILRSHKLTRWYFPIFIISWLSISLQRFIEDDSPKLHQVHWGEQVSIIILLIFVAAILIMIVIKISGWDNDPENTNVQIQTAMRSFF